MTVIEAAKQLEVSPDTVYDLCAGGLLRHRRIGLKGWLIRISPEDIEAYLDSVQVNAHGAGPMPRVAPAIASGSFSPTGARMAKEDRRRRSRHTSDTQP